MKNLPAPPLTELILENLLDAVLIVDGQGKIQYANKAAEALFNKPLLLLHNEIFGFPVEPYNVQEIQVVNNGRVMILQMLASTIMFEGHNAFLLSLRDITLQKETEAKLEEERNKLELLNLENEQYASLASHDLKEPVRKILMFADMLLNHPPDRLFDAKHKLKKIIESATRMQFLMNGIADYSRLAKNRTAYELTDLNTVLKNVCDDLELLMKEHKVKIMYSGLPAIQAIPVQMHQLFLNLVSNSIKYGKKGIAPLISIKAENNYDNITIMFSDNGIGFDNQYAQKIFSPFARLHSNEYEGSGIGLAICKKIVELHGGNITVNSSPGHGTQFLIRLKK